MELEANKVKVNKLWQCMPASAFICCLCTHTCCRSIEDHKLCVSVLVCVTVNMCATASRRPPMQASPVMPPAAKRPRQDSNPSLQRSNLVTLANSSKNQVMTRPRPQPRPTPYTSVSKIASAAIKRATATVSKSATNASRASSSGELSLVLLIGD